MKIAVKIDDNGIVTDTTETSEYAAEQVAGKDGWILVERDPTFLTSERYSWLVRKSDNVLVHANTGKTPDEEMKNTIKILTEGQLNGQLTDKQVQEAVTAMTKQVIQNQLTSQMAITELTKQVASLTIKLDEANGVDPTPDVPTDVQSVATTDGAIISAK